ncbi:MAG: tetratricopeptide repeat protein [Gemmatimonadota bacterium]|nr:tetratricopeptide repeat protein [Gemmatimonadota bacterium]MDE2983475.1 tetratricopeptide repeat protein [Gemmatimonadota bacterium]
MSSYRKPGTRPPKPESPVDQEDAFVAATLEASNWAQKNRPIVTLGVVVLGLGVAAFVYYGRYRDTLRTNAALQLEEMQLRLAAGDPATLQTDLELYLDRFSGTPFAGEARVTLAQVNTDLGDREGAAEVLRPLAGDVGNPLGAQAAAMLAAIAEDMGDLQMAEGLYERLADGARLGFQRRDALASAARLRYAQGDPAGALTHYDRLLAEMDEMDPGRGVVEMRRAEVVAMAR